MVLRENKLILSKDSPSSASASLLTHPPFCPMHCLSPADKSLLPASTVQRGVNVGVVVILESRDGEVLVTRRAKHMRTFPGIWVPPGGHIELGETLLEAGMRELQVSETDLTLTVCLARRRLAWPCPLWWSPAVCSACGRVSTPTSSAWDLRPDIT